MGRGKSQPVIYLLLDSGIKPKTLINKLGYKPSIVYSYNRKYKLAKEEYHKIMETQLVGV